MASFCAVEGGSPLVYLQNKIWMMVMFDCFCVRRLEWSPKSTSVRHCPKAIVLCLCKLCDEYRRAGLKGWGESSVTGSGRAGFLHCCCRTEFGEWDPGLVLVCMFVPNTPELKLQKIPDRRFHPNRSYIRTKQQYLN